MILRVFKFIRFNSTPSQPERLLGGYLFALAFYQIVIYLWPSGPPFMLDPRGGIPVLLINHFSFDNKIIFQVEWITTTWLIVLAAMLFFYGKFLKTYLVSEAVMAAPTAYYVGVLAVHHGGNFGLELKDLLLTVCLFTLFSLVPIAYAAKRLRDRRKRRE